MIIQMRIKLPDPPAGQGCFYEALSKDLRPSLSWSPECGWMVPMSGELNNGWHCARLNWLHEQDAQTNCSLRNVKTEFSSANLISETANSPDKGRDEYCTFAKSSTREDCYSLGSEENSNLATSKCLVSARSSGTTLESCIMNLEEIACKVRWLKGLLKYGHKWSDLMNRSWKFLEGHESHLQHLHVEDFVLQKGGLGEM
ncbi:hypothetical protein HPP92_015457 [Vanilla planifolia]|uniref:Uncharacterized protein n=1 Tax=Vanilla planifolia TaxID=51239 RepID=A0A835QRF6_VANPL|nr:hypothetical protein HPP92_015457 [Vanilla planifolia]